MKPPDETDAIETENFDHREQLQMQFKVSDSLCDIPSICLVVLVFVGCLGTSNLYYNLMYFDPVTTTHNF